MRICFLVGVALGCALAGCGGSSSPRPLSERAFKDASARVCEQTRVTYNKIGVDPFTVAGLATKADRASDLYLAEIPQLRRLTPPKRIAKQMSKELQRMRDVAQQYKRGAARLRTQSDQHREVTIDAVETFSSAGAYEPGYVTWVAYLNLSYYCWPPAD